MRHLIPIEATETNATRNAYLLSRYALAAYPDSAKERMTLASEIAEAGGMCRYVENDDTEVLIVAVEGHLIIAIAGTESARD